MHFIYGITLFFNVESNNSFFPVFFPHFSSSSRRKIQFSIIISLVNCRPFQFWHGIFPFSALQAVSVYRAGHTYRTDLLIPATFFLNTMNEEKLNNQKNKFFPCDFSEINVCIKQQKKRKKWKRMWRTKSQQQRQQKLNTI